MNEIRKAPKVVKVPTPGGGWTEVESTPQEVKAQNPDKAAEAMAVAQEKDFFKRVGACTESLNKFLKVYAADHGLEPEEVVAAVYLENCNNRFFYPEDKGGKTRFDAVTSGVWAWFKENIDS